MTATDPMLTPVDSDQRALPDHLLKERRDARDEEEHVIQPRPDLPPFSVGTRRTERLSFEILAAFSGIQTPQTV